MMGLRLRFEDSLGEASIVTPIDCPALPSDVMTYLQKRFRMIKQLGGLDGYSMLWQAGAAT